MSAPTTPKTKDPAGKEKEYYPYTQQEVGYTQVSPTAGQACQNCRWWKGYTCSIVTDMAPKDIVSMGWCNKWETEPAEITAIVQPVVIMDESAVTGIIATLPSGFGERSGEYVRTPPTNIIVKGKTQPVMQKQTLIRDKAGRRYMFIVTSNGYKDREDEWIPAAELKSYVDGCWIDEKTFHSDNPLLFWHDEKLKAGDIIWADMDGPFLIELAREGDTPIAKALWDYREANPGDELWGASHGFRYQQRSADGVYAGIRKKETSFLPLWAAANSLTASEVLTVMSEKSRNDYVNNLFKTFGVENAADLLRTGTQTLADKLAAAGVQNKSADGTTTQQPFMSKEAASLIVEMVDAQSDMLGRLEAIETKQKEAPVIPPELQTQLNTIGAAVRQIQATLELAPTQASKDASTVVDPKTDETAQQAAADLAQKQVGNYDPLFPGMNIPISGGR